MKKRIDSAIREQGPNNHVMLLWACSKFKNTVGAMDRNSRLKSCLAYSLAKPRHESAEPPGCGVVLHAGPIVRKKRTNQNKLLLPVG